MKNSKIKDAGTVYDDLLDKLNHVESFEDVLTLIDQICNEGSLQEEEFDDLISKAIKRREILKVAAEKGMSDPKERAIEKEPGKSEFDIFNLYHVDQSGNKKLIRRLKSGEPGVIKNTLVLEKKALEESGDYPDIYPRVSKEDYETGEVLNNWQIKPQFLNTFAEPKKVAPKQPTTVDPLPPSPDKKQEPIKEEINLGEARDLGYEVADEIIDMCYGAMDNTSAVDIHKKFKVNESTVELQLHFEDDKIDLMVGVYLDDRFNEEFNLAVLDTIEDELNSEFKTVTKLKKYDQENGAVLLVSNSDRKLKLNV